MSYRSAKIKLHVELKIKDGNDILFYY